MVMVRSTLMSSTASRRRRVTSLRTSPPMTTSKQVAYCTLQAKEHKNDVKRRDRRAERGWLTGAMLFLSAVSKRHPPKPCECAFDGRGAVTSEMHEPSLKSLVMI